ncbi:MAG: winged helix-turn-helix domain-containing protein [Candidatus Odinarchaeota archaeon]
MPEEPSDIGFPIIDDIDRVIHEPARLLIMSHLYVLDSANFLFLKRQTGLSDGNLSSHITKLENAGYVEIIKKFVNRKPLTVIQLTKVGREAFREYQRQMQHMFEGIGD